MAYFLYMLRKKIFFFFLSFAFLALTLFNYSSNQVQKFSRIFLLPPAHASCGISHCNLVRHSSESPSSWKALNLFRFTQDARTSYFYIEDFIGLGWNPTSSLNVMFLSPLVYVEDQPLGWGNSIVQLDYQWTFSSWGIASGFQVEVPTANQNLYGDSHSVVLPYLRGWFTQGKFSFQGLFGFAQTLDFGDHDHSHDHHDHHNHDHGTDEHHTPSPLSSFMINPHASSEIPFRIQAQWSPFIRDKWIELILGLDGVKELSEAHELSLNGLFGLQSQLSWGRLQAFLFNPLADHTRFERRFIFLLSIPFGAPTIKPQKGGQPTLVSATF